MSLLEDIFSEIFVKGIWLIIRRIGAFIRWSYLRNSYSFGEVLNQKWNGRIGLLTIFFIALALYSTRKHWYMAF